MKKKLSAIVLAAAMTASMTTTAFATAPTPGMGSMGDFDANAAKTEVNIQGMSDTDIEANLSATVPLSVKLAVMASGEIKGPSNYDLTNTSLSKKIKVSKIEATAETGYSTHGTPSDAQVDLKNVTLKSSKGGTAVTLNSMGTSGHTPGAADTGWKLASKNDADTASDSSNVASITFGGNIPDLSKLSTGAQGENGEKAFTLIYTIEVDK